MDYFRYIIKCILRKIPLKLLLIIAIVLLLFIICFNAKSFAYTGYYSFLDNQDYQEIFSSSQYNNVTYISECPTAAYDVLINRTEFQSGNYDYLLLTYNDPSIPSTQEKGRVAMFLFNKYADFKVYPQEFGRGGYIQKLVVSTSLTNYAYQFICDVYGNNLVVNTGPSVTSTLNVICNADNNLGVTYLGVISSRDIYTDNTFNTTFINGYEIDTYTSPYIVNSSSVDTWSFNNLFISLGSEDYNYTEDGIGYEPTWWSLNIDYMGSTYYVNPDLYIYEQEGIDETIFKFPRSVLSSYFNLYNGEDITFSLSQFNKLGDELRSKTFTLDTYTLNLTSAEQIIINADSEKYTLGSIDTSISNVNTTITDFYSSFTYTNVNSDLVGALFDTGDDITINDSSGIENFFLILYNAFCENQVVNVHVTIPFTDKTMTISSAEVSSYFPQPLRNIMYVVSYGAICLFICRDIRKMVDKSLEGNAENISHDIKREVL